MHAIKNSNNMVVWTGCLTKKCVTTFKDALGLIFGSCQNQHFIHNLWAPFGSYLRNKAFVVCFVSLNFNILGRISWNICTTQIYGSWSKIMALLIYELLVKSFSNFWPSQASGLHLVTFGLWDCSSAHDLNIRSNWTCLISFRGGFNIMFLWPIKFVCYIKGSSYSTFAVFQMLILLCKTSIFLPGHKLVKRLTADFFFPLLLFMAGQKAVNASYFNHVLNLSVTHPIIKWSDLRLGH